MLAVSLPEEEKSLDEISFTPEMEASIDIESFISKALRTENNCSEVWTGLVCPF